MGLFFCFIVEIGTIIEVCMMNDMNAANDKIKGSTRYKVGTLTVTEPLI